MLGHYIETQGPEITLNRYRVSTPGIARVLSNTRLTPEGGDEVRHLVLDIEGLDYPYLEGQSLGVLMPGQADGGRPHKLRLYSIASGRAGEDGRSKTLALCVKRVLVRDPQTGAVRRRGLASNYLCDLRPGDPIAITGPAGKNFLLPEDPGSNLILVATGTGIAPFRAFLMRIYDDLDAWNGRVELFFGVRKAAECLYRDQLEGYRAHPGFHLSQAFSREQQAADGQRMYVHHRIEERMEELWPLLKSEKTLLYLCGLKGMEGRILEVLHRRADREGISWTAFHRHLRDTGRLRIETY